LVIKGALRKGEYGYNWEGLYFTFEKFPKPLGGGLTVKSGGRMGQKKAFIIAEIGGLGKMGL